MCLPFSFPAPVRWDRSPLDGLAVSGASPASRQLSCVPSYPPPPVIMPQPGLHPAMNLVRVVMTNGATYTTRMAWQSPIPRATVHRFLDADATTHELWTGKATVEPRVGRAATFHRRHRPHRLPQSSEKKNRPPRGRRGCPAAPASLLSLQYPLSLFP